MNYNTPKHANTIILLPKVKCVTVACQVRYRRCHPRDGGTDLASTASDQDSDLREWKSHR